MIEAIVVSSNGEKNWGKLRVDISNVEELFISFLCSETERNDRK